MSSTSNLNVINIQIRAEDQVRIDSNEAATDPQYSNLRQQIDDTDSKYYLWHGDLEAIPMGLGALRLDSDGNVDVDATIAGVQTYVQQMAVALPAANVLRIPFNENNFHADGSMDIRFEAFLEEAAAQGYQIIMGYFGGNAQGRAFDKDTTAQEAHDLLSGTVFDQMEEGWNGMLDWLDAHPNVANALYGLELINEPAAYSSGASRDDENGLQDFVELYVEHVNALGDMIDPRIDTNILVGGWAFSNRFYEFAEIEIDGTTALDLIRQGIGNDLVWSSHFYGGWNGNRNGSTYDDYLESFERHYADLGDDNILVTEMNARGTSANNWAVAQFNHFVFSRAAEWFAENGIGISWFPGVQSGASGLAVITGGQITYRHPDSFAIANHLFTTDEDPAAHAAGEVIVADRIDIREIRDESLSVDSNGDGIPDSGNLGLDVEDVDVGIAFGYGGDDTITGHDDAWDFLYGGDGNDVISGLAGNDWLFGQRGHDLIQGGDGNDKLFGNQGNDTLEGGAGDNQLEGGSGADLFRIQTDGINVVVDFNELQGDTIEIDGVAYTLAELTAMGIQVDADLQGRATDLLINHADGAQTLILNVVDAPDVTIHGTAGDDLIASLTTNPDGTENGYQDAEGDNISRFAESVFAGDGNDTVRADWGDDYVRGQAGDDELNGDRGQDTLFGDSGNDKLNGGDGDDELTGGGGADSLAGGEGDDLLIGSEGNDTLVGNDGADILQDGTGKDDMTGGEGADIFVMAAGDGQQDRIKDFYVGIDKIDLSAWGVTDFSQVSIDPRSNNQGYVTNEWILSYNGESIRITTRGVASELVNTGNPEGDPNPFVASDILVYARPSINGTEGDDKGGDRLEGTDASEDMYGLGGSDDIRAGNGDDRIFDGTGNDAMTGGAGNDIFVLTASDGARDRIRDFELGGDKVDLSTWGVTSRDDLNITFRNGKTDEFLVEVNENTSEAFYVRILGADGSLMPDMLTAEHFIFGGGSGTPEPDPDPVLVRYDGTEGDDKGASRIVGTTADDEIYGNGGDDDLRGNGGDDFLYDGAGRDDLFGGLGADTFVLTFDDGQKDRIKDFQLDDDIIDLSGWGLTGFTDLDVTFRDGRTDELEVALTSNPSDIFYVRVSNEPGLEISDLTADHFVF